MKKNFRCFVLLTIAFSLMQFASVYSQLSKYHVEFFQKSGELTKKDLLKKDFGRYDGYQIYLAKNEIANFFVYSENFSPSLVLVDPQSEMFVRKEGGGNEFVSLQEVIPKGGDWIVYVLGDTSAYGNYYFQYAFTDSSSISIKKGSNFCENLNYLIAHSTAHFVFLDNFTGNNLYNFFEDAVDAYIDSHDASYDALMYDGNSKVEAQKIFDSLISSVKECIGGGWKNTESNWKNTDEGMQKYFLLQEKNKKEARYVRINFSDFSESNNNYGNNYIVELIINRE